MILAKRCIVKVYSQGFLLYFVYFGRQRTLRTLKNAQFCVKSSDKTAFVYIRVFAIWKVVSGTLNAVSDLMRKCGVSVGEWIGKDMGGVVDNAAGHRCGGSIDGLRGL